MNKRLAQTLHEEDIQMANTWVKRCSSLVTRKMLIEITTSYLYTTTRMTKMRKKEKKTPCIDEDLEQLKLVEV